LWPWSCRRIAVERKEDKRKRKRVGGDKGEKRTKKKNT
jgi:hypothetical protein